MRKRIGEFLVEKGVLTPAQVEEILSHSRRTSLRFGDAGLDLGLITRDKMIHLFGASYSVDFFHLDSEFFPRVTKDLLPVEDILRLGALPLGFKLEQKLFRSKKVLNLGLLDPSRADAVAEASRAASLKLGDGEVQGVKVFLVLADQFLRVLREVYGLEEGGLREVEQGKALDDTLAMFLENPR